MVLYLKLHKSWPKLQTNSIIKGKAVNVDNTKMWHNDFTWAAIACVIVYSVSPWNCLHKDLHCTGEISTSPGETYILYRFSHEKKTVAATLVEAQISHTIKYLLPCAWSQWIHRSFSICILGRCCSTGFVYERQIKYSFNLIWLLIQAYSSHIR